MIRWSIDSIHAIARRVARLTGRTEFEVYPVITLRDRRLVGVYVRDVGWVRP